MLAVPVWKMDTEIIYIAGVCLMYIPREGYRQKHEAVYMNCTYVNLIYGLPCSKRYVLAVDKVQI